MNVSAVPSSRRPHLPPLFEAESACAAQLVAEVGAICSGEPGDLTKLGHALRRFVQTTELPRPERWSDTTGRYTRVLLNDPDDPFQIVVIFWPPGARSAIHDHDATRGAVMSLFGHVTETKYEVVASSTPGHVRLSASEAVALEPGVLSPITPEPGLQLHDMVNDSYAWAATIHVYLRAIEQFAVYRVARGLDFVRDPRTLWFDYVRGAADWDRADAAPPSSARHRLGRRGGCACGAVRFESESAPVLQLRCYCSDCRKSTGSAMAPLAFFPSDAIRISEGTTDTHQWRNDSGYVVSRQFCPCCGTTLFHGSTSYRHLRAIPVGVLDDSTHFRPTTNIYVGSAPAWARKG